MAAAGSTAVAAVDSTVAVEAGSMEEEVVGLTVGKGAAMSLWSGELQEARQRRFTRIRFGPSSPANDNMA